MSETMIAALIGAGVTLLTALITQITTIACSIFKAKLEIKQKEYKSKRDSLNEVYKNLISIINIFPNASPNDILKNLEHAPHYSMEHFDSILNILDYQIEDYTKQINISNIDRNRKSNIEIQLENREYSKNKISQIRDKYYVAKDRYRYFCESDKAIFDIYAGQDVRNCLIEFEVVIHNVFISGRSVGIVEDTMNNIIEISHQKLINAMRYDIGIH